MQILCHSAEVRCPIDEALDSPSNRVQRLRRHVMCYQGGGAVTRPEEAGGRDSWGGPSPVCCGWTRATASDAAARHCVLLGPAPLAGLLGGLPACIGRR
ncbi:hypothetical protein GCM10009525_48050 [Streptosporangium amethystogenes subsp. fukuiense]